ncbi:MAG: hypothetical protein K2G32_05100 [Oscillospiraceae bacterium]|nr:hypothetical protein [Oscillospiraceae bacterium]
MKNKKALLSVIIAMTLLMSACDEEKPMSTVPNTTISTTTIEDTTKTTTPDIRMSIYVYVSELRRVNKEAYDLQKEYTTFIEEHGGIDNLTADQILYAISIAEKSKEKFNKLLDLVDNCPKDDLTADEEEYLAEVLKELQD